MTCRSVLLAIALALPVATWAQDTPPVDSLALLKQLLGPAAAFTASAVLTGVSSNDEDSFVMEVDYVVLQRRLRTETDLTKLRGAHACDNAQDRLREVGMDQIITIIDPELKRSYTVYPRAQAYVDSPIDWRERLKELSDIQKTELGRETVAGHPCIKSRVLATDQMGNESEVLVWEASDLNRFPIQLRFEVPQGAFTMLFHDVRLTPPDIAMFQPPAEFYRYTDLAQLARAIRGH
jgi:hypothetical protein